MIYIIEEMDKPGADGVDFVPVCTTKDTFPKTIYMSKNQTRNVRSSWLAKVWSALLEVS